MALIDEYRRVINLADQKLKYYGVNMYNRDKTSKKFQFLYLLDTFLYICVNLYSLTYYKDFVSILFCLITFELGIQCFTQFLVAAIYKKQFLKINQVIVDVYEKRPSFAEKSVNATLKKYSMMTRKTHSILDVFMYSSAIVTGAYPPLYWILTKKLTLSFGFILPFVDPTSKIGYIFNNIFQYMQIICVVNLCYGFIVYFATFIIHLTCQIDIIKNLLNHITKVSEECKNIKQSDDIDKYLKFIVWYHQQHNELALMTMNLFKNQLLIELGCITFQIAVALFILISFQHTYVPGYTLVIFGTIQLLVACCIGTLLEIKQNELVDAIYVIPWYLFSISNQKIVLQFLLASHTPTYLSFGGFFPLNLATFLQVYKSIYTYLMMLLSFAE